MQIPAAVELLGAERVWDTRALTHFARVQMFDYR